MLIGILNSDKAINMNNAVMQAFVEIRKIVLHQPDENVSRHRWNEEHEEVV